RGNQVAVKQLVEDFARYLYLPRLAGPEVLIQAMRDGVALLTWRSDSFAYAESYDEAASRYRGLRGGQGIGISVDSSGLLVKPGVAGSQLDSELATTGPTPRPEPRPDQQPGTGLAPVPPPQFRRFHGSVRLDSARVGRDAGRIADEVIAHLAGQMGAEV